MSFSAALLTLILASAALASDEPDELVKGKLLVITAQTFRFTGKPPVRGATLDLHGPAVPERRVRRRDGGVSTVGAR